MAYFLYKAEKDYEEYHFLELDGERNINKFMASSLAEYSYLCVTVEHNIAYVVDTELHKSMFDSKTSHDDIFAIYERIGFCHGFITRETRKIYNSKKGKYIIYAGQKLYLVI